MLVDLGSPCADDALITFAQKDQNCKTITKARLRIVTAAIHAELRALAPFVSVSDMMATFYKRVLEAQLLNPVLPIDVSSDHSLEIETFGLIGTDSHTPMVNGIGLMQKCHED